jgi:ABC-type polysaccharide/polyol phosphate transport system ATPase subunit
MTALLQLRGARIRYPVFASGQNQSILTAMAQTATFGAIGRSTAGITHVEGLRGVSLDLRPGTRLGVIGSNGSGKSTLLRTLAGISWPHAGQRRVVGRVSSILTIGSGLNMEKSGRDNVRFVCKLFGVTKADAEAIVAEVEAFTELGEFFDLPVRTYSSGMVVRLSFAISTSMPGDILIVDEVLGAGDLHFLERAAAKMRARVQDSSILVLATHSPSALAEFADHVIWMRQGRIVAAGDPMDIWQRYNADDPMWPDGTSKVLAFPRRADFDTDATPESLAAE